MITRDEILAAASTGSLLSTLATVPYDATDQLADVLAELHNDRSLDVLKIFRSNELAAFGRRSFFRLQDVFCQLLPRLRCPVAETAATCKVLFDKAGDDLAAGRVYSTFRDWLQVSRCRTDEGLMLVRCDLDNQTGVTLHVLLAGAMHDPKKYAEEALDLSRQPQPHIREDALIALGRMALEDDGVILVRITERLDQVIESRYSDRDAATAIEAALQLLARFGEKLLHAVEPLLVKASSNPPPITRHAIAVGLHRGHHSYTDAMIDVSFSALRHVDGDSPQTIKTIDAILSGWDLDGDRKRVLRFLRHLLSKGDNVVDLEALDSFQHKLTNGPGDLLGWYVISLLLTGDHRLCRAAYGLLPHKEAPVGLDIDLTEFGLDSAWIRFLAGKILGYCLTNRSSASALLLSCLRGTSGESRADLETLVLSSFLINHPSAIKWLEAAVSPDDPAEQSVKRLSSTLKAYLEGIHQAGSCAAFRPSDRECQLQAYRQGDLAQSIWKGVQERSLFSRFVHHSVLLYGSGSIYYGSSDKDSDPQRRETPLTTHRQTIEIPRLELLDPVGLRYAIVRFRLETPPI